MLLKVTVPEPGVKAVAPALFVQLPPTLIALAVPAARVPAVSVNVPLILSVVVEPPTVKVLLLPLLTVRWLKL